MNLSNMPTAGLVVMIVIGLLFVLSLLLLFHVYLRYKLLAGKAKGDPEKVRGFRAAVLAEYTNAYQKYGQDTNTPAIITDTVAAKLSGLLFCERFLNNAVSLFVTLGLFGTFLGLSISVASLTELLRYSSGEDWLSVMDSVGGGLLSALSGMGVAFYTSLVGAGCSILLTILKTIFNPQAAREQMETRMELWLDTEVAPDLYTEAAKNDSDLVRRMIAALKSASDDFGAAAKGASASLAQAAKENRAALAGWNKSLEKFNEGVHDFAEVDYNLRGSVERMDLAVRDLAGAMREINRRMEGGSASGKHAKPAEQAPGGGTKA